MSSPRITQRLMVERSLSSLQTGLGRLSRTQEQLSSGRIINRPSDSPTGTNDAMRLRAQMAADTQYSRNAADGLSFLGRTDNTLTTMVDGVRRFRELLVQGASTGAVGPDARQAIAAELTQIRDSLLTLANTQHMGRPLFGGTTGNATAYDTAGVFMGDQEKVLRTVGEGLTVRVNITGPEAFTSKAGDDLFKVLDDAITRVTADPSLLGNSMSRLDGVNESMLTALADVGTRYGRVETAVQALMDVGLTNTTALSNVENVDVAEAVVNLQLQEVAYQAALGATARVLQPSLLDFLR